MKDVAEMFAKYDQHLRIKGTKECEKCGYEYPIITDDSSEIPYGDGEDVVLSDNCPKCLVNEEDDQFRQIAKERLKNKNNFEYNRFSLIPEDLEDATFDNFKPENFSQENALEIVKSFVKDELEKTTLFFQGDTGLGKSHLSYCAHQYYNNERYQSAVFVDVPGLLEMIKNTYDKSSSKTQDQIMNAIKTADLLILDDIGAEYAKPDANGYESWTADILFQIANARQKKKNIYTTNFTAKHLTKKYGMMSKRIISRMMNNAKVIKIEGDDHRLKGLE